MARTTTALDNSKDIEELFPNEDDYSSESSSDAYNEYDATNSSITAVLMGNENSAEQQ